MSTLSIATHARHTNNDGYLKNVARAARALLAALVSVPAHRTPPRVESATELYRLANFYEGTCPGLAQELRYFASRD